jgi:hypothetical protein
MKRAKDLKSFCNYVTNYLGHGYTSVLIVNIPLKKEHKKDLILQKIEKNYHTYMSRSQRAYAKSKGFANFGAVQFKNTVVIMHTNGSIKQEIDYGNGFVSLNKFSANISDFLSVDFYKDERDKYTCKLSKEIYADIKNGTLYHLILKRLCGFPRFRGFQLQRARLKEFLRKNHKDYAVKWSIPQYL